MTATLLLLLYCVFIVAASLFGGWLPFVTRLTHRHMQLAMSTVGGFMLGIALLHLVPHSFAELGSLDATVGWTLAGLLAMFLLIRVFHVHAHEHGDAAHEHGDEHRPHADCSHPDHEHHPHPDHDHACLHEGAKEHAGSGSHRFSWMGLALGLALHTIIDGLALGAAVAADANHSGAPALPLFGIGTFLAVLLHKPLDSLSITSLMAAGGWSKRSAFTANLLFALMCPAGAIAFWLGLDQIGSQQLVVGCSLAFAAGVFLCISLADLLPELTFHAHDRLPLTVALFFGVGLAWGVGYFEPKHAHDHGQERSTDEHPGHSHSDHPHAGHDH